VLDAHVTAAGKCSAKLVEGPLQSLGSVVDGARSYRNSSADGWHCCPRKSSSLPYTGKDEALVSCFRGVHRSRAALPASNTRVAGHRRQRLGAGGTLNEVFPRRRGLDSDDSSFRVRLQRTSGDVHQSEVCCLLSAPRPCTAACRVSAQ